MTAYFRLVLRLRWPLLAVVTVITALAGWNITRAVVATSFGRLFLGEHPGYPEYLERVAEFGGDEVVAVALEAPDVFSAGSRDRLGEAVAAVEAVKGVERAYSVLDVQEVTGRDDTLQVRPYAEAAEGGAGAAREALARLRADPFARGLILSDDGRHIAVIVELVSDAERSAEDTPGIVDGVLRAFEAQGYPRESLHLVGLPASISAVVSETYFNLERLLPLVAVVLLVVVWLMFRRLWPVAMTTAVAIVSVVWTMGFAVLLDRQVSILAAMVPSVVLIIAFSDVVHLCSAYLLELGKGVSKREAIIKSGAEVGAACLLTSATTFLGFFALSLIPTPAFRYIGLVLGFGVGVALLLAMTLLPVFFSILPQPKPWKAGTAGRVQDLLDGVLARVAALAAGRPRTVIAAFFLFLGLCAVGLLQLEFETDFSQRMPEDHPLRVAERYVQQHFAGSNTVDLYLETGQQDGLLDPAVFGKIAECQDAMPRLAGVTRASSLVDLIEVLHRELTAGDEGTGRLPGTRQALAQYLLLFESSGGEDLERLIDFERQTLRMTLNLPEGAFLHTFLVGEAAEARARQILEPVGVSVQASGLVYLMGEFLEVILIGQRNGLLFACVTIALLMMIGLRSIRIGLWSMFPNLLPLVALGGVLGLAYDKVDSDAVALAVIAIGIGVDDTIHFLMRFRLESRRQEDSDEAIRRTFHYAGRGIVITSVILVAGFLPFASTEYLSLFWMGTLLPLTFVVALLADLLLVPALVKLGLMRYRT